jgi:two-component system chemotaxis response regulator CheB
MNRDVKRVLICEDSGTFAAGLSRLLEHDGEIAVVGVCSCAEEAIDALPRLHPDLLTMDVELPGMSGLEAVEQIMGARPLPILVISSTVASRDSSMVAAALAAGALDALPKSDLDLRDPSSVSGVALRRRVKLLSGARVIRHPRARLAPGAEVRLRARTARAIGICVSTGGPRALVEVLSSLPGTFPVPILVVQHISAGFIDGFVKWLDSELPLTVRLAAGGEQLSSGVWVAPDGAHLVLGDDGRLALDRTTEKGAHRPSGDVLLASLAQVAGKLAVGVVMTGMGRDGAEGLAAIKAAGGLTIAQDEGSCAVYGMPAAAAASANLVLAPQAIARRLAALYPPEEPR